MVPKAKLLLTIKTLDKQELEQKKESEQIEEQEEAEDEGEDMATWSHSLEEKSKCDVPKNSSKRLKMERVPKRRWWDK